MKMLSAWCYLWLLFIGILPQCDRSTAYSEIPYHIAEIPWTDSLGNHRAVIEVDSTAHAISLQVDWRRPDNNPDQHAFLIINATTGESIANIQRKKVTQEVCQLFFGPVQQTGTYYFYYLPYPIVDGWGSYYKQYVPKEAPPSADWVDALGEKQWPKARVTCLEARTDYDSFYPMEVAATTSEWNAYREKTDSTFFIFPEDRQFPIRMKHKVPYKWLAQPQGKPFEGEALKDEYYAFQLGLVTVQDTLKEVNVQWSSLQNENTTIEATKLTCFNVEGVDPLGNHFTKSLTIPPHTVQSLWFGVDIARDQKPGTYTGTVTLQAANAPARVVPIAITVGNKVIEERGDNETWRHSRLRWLNSTRGIDNNPTNSYPSIQCTAENITCLGRMVQLQSTSALPAQIISWQYPLLAAPICVEVQTDEGLLPLQASLKNTQQEAGMVAWEWQASHKDLSVTLLGRMEFDGWMHYSYTLSGKKVTSIRNVALRIPFVQKEVPYFMGMGHEGQATPTRLRTQWNGPYDSFWLGSVHSGLHCELRGTTYSGPLLNLYKPAYPSAWYNNGKGSITLETHAGTVTASAQSGSFTLNPNQPVTFEWALLITPVKTVDYTRQFVERYYHNGGAPVPAQEDLDAGIKVINVHHATRYNPFINYPFLSVDRMAALVDEMHQKGVKVKMYYTIRELTNLVTEVWALRSLGYEILADGRGGGYPWLQEHFVDHYTPQWYHHFAEADAVNHIPVDASVLTATGSTRWYNYYIEGLAWIIKHTNIDGLYLDDVAFDREMMKRIRKVMTQVKPDCFIDLHSNTGFSKGPAMQYAEYFPYIDKIWFGESFQYSKMSPENWIVEVSGLPFGHMGDMLHAGGNRWLGMQYGMTVRHPWRTEGVVCDPRVIWKIWDDFEIATASMNGFWEDHPAVTTDHRDVKVTSYIKEGKTLLSIGNYSDKTQSVHLHIDWKALGLDPATIRLTAPAIEDFQPACTFSKDQPIVVPPRKGWLILLEPQL